MGRQQIGPVLWLCAAAVTLVAVATLWRPIAQIAPLLDVFGGLLLLVAIYLSFGGTWSIPHRKFFHWPGAGPLLANIGIAVGVVIFFTFLTQLAHEVWKPQYWQPGQDDDIVSKVFDAAAQQVITALSSSVGMTVLASTLSISTLVVVSSGAGAASAPSVQQRQLDDISRRLDEIARMRSASAANFAADPEPPAPPSGGDKPKDCAAFAGEAPRIYERLLQLRTHLLNYRRKPPSYEEMLDALRRSRFDKRFTDREKQSCPLLEPIDRLMLLINATLDQYTPSVGPARPSRVVEATIQALSMALERDMRILEEKLFQLANQDAKSADAREAMRELHYAFDKYTT